MVSDVVGDVVNDAVSNVVSESVVVSSKGVGSEGVVSGTVAELVADLASGLASDLPADFEFGCSELRFALELTPRFAAPLGLDLESLFLLIFSSAFAPNLESDFEVVATAAN